MDDDSVKSDGGDSPKRKAEIEVAMVEGEGEGMEIDGGEVVKRRKKEVENGGHGDEMVMKRVAEIVLVLSAMGRMRAGRDPTVAEKAMMAEARSKVVALCEELAPKDVVPLDAFGGVIEDLGLNRLKDSAAFRPPKISISDKIALSKRRMEESKTFAAQPASYTSQRVQTANGAAVDNRGTPPVHVLPSDKTGHLPVSTATFQPPTPVANVSAAASAPVQLHPPGFEVRPAAHSPVLLNNVGKNSTSVPPPRHDRAHIRPEGRPNGQSLPHVSVSSAASQHVSRTTAHLRPQPPVQANVGTKNVVSDQLPVRTDSNVSLSAPRVTSQSAVAQMPGLTGQAAPGALRNVHHPVQGMPFVHGPVVNHHLEVSRLVQKLLSPKLPPRSVWTPPSRDYMNRALPCQFCKNIINEVENMVVCDACEKGFHLGCLQSHNAKSIRGEWHCPRCLTMSHGKPFPPKYGRVTRNMNVPKVLSNTTGVQLSSDKKVGNMGEKVNQQNQTIDRIQDFKTHSQVSKPNAITNGGQDSKMHSQAVKAIGSSTESILQCRSDNVPIGEKDDRPKSENHLNNTTGAAVEASPSATTKASSDKPFQQVKTEITSEDCLTPETGPQTQAISQSNQKNNDLATSTNENDVEKKVEDNIEIPVHQHSETNGVIETHQCKDNEKDVQKNMVEIRRDLDQVEELDVASESGLHDVEWIGDADSVVDKKKFFRSCRINGIAYQVQKYALLPSRDGKLIPMKLQAMWEDSQTSSKWVLVHKCYFPDDLPEEVGRPGAPQSNEVYESTHDNCVLAGFVQGPCEVLPFRKFGEETEKNNQGSLAKDGRRPIFIRNWFYDDTRRAFCPSAS
ncbi:hypothetical protein RDABS01_033131 [Bienertia sinuspersici]